MSDNTPIIPEPFTHGVTVVDIGDARVARGLTRRPLSSCTHKSMVYDPRERRIWCSDCETEVPAFDAFMSIVEGYDRALKAAKRKINEAREAETRAIRSRAAKVMDKAWSSRTMLPICPHCRRGIAPEDVLKGTGSVSREYAAMLVKRESGK